MTESGTPGSGVAAADPSGGSAAAKFSERERTLVERVQHLLHSHSYLSPLIVLALSYVVFTMLNQRFILPANQATMIKAVVVVAILALGQTLIILTAGIDLSVGFIALLSMMVMAKLFHERNPLPPATRKSNSKELIFDTENGRGLKSEYTLACARNLDAGRSQGIHYLHGSECAYWPDPETLCTSLLSCVPDPPTDSEVIFESTANGYGNRSSPTCSRPTPRDATRSTRKTASPTPGTIRRGTGS